MLSNDAVKIKGSRVSNVNSISPSKSKGKKVGSEITPYINLIIIN